MTLASDNASRFAWRLDDNDPLDSPVVRAVRNDAVRRATRLRRKGFGGALAHDVMLTAVERQARLLGLRDVHLPRPS